MHQPGLTRRLAAVAAAGALCTTATWGLAAAAPAASQGKIVFSAEVNGNEDIYVVNADGSGLKRLTTAKKLDVDPEFSPDGKKIVFASSRRDGKFSGYDIYVMNADGSGQARLTDDSFSDYQPTFSPDGKNIAFISNRFGNTKKGEVFVMDVDGSKEKRLTSTGGFFLYPEYSPDGEQIVVTRGTHNGLPEIWILNADGTDVTQLTNDNADGDDRFPTFSRNGKKITFVREDGQKGDLWTMNTDGSGAKNLTKAKDFYGAPTYSPDGKRIAFATERFTNADEIFSVKADGTGRTRITRNAFAESAPNWG